MSELLDFEPLPIPRSLKRRGILFFSRQPAYALNSPMKLIHVSSRVSFLALAALGVATPSRPIAQTIQFYGVEKRITYSQTSSAAPSSPATTINDPSGPYF